MKDTVRVALIQGKPYPELDDPRNVGHAITLLEKCHGKDVDVACLPEYFPWGGEEILADMASRLRCYIVAGLVEDMGNKRFNTATLFDRNGRIVGRQRKVHTGTMERRHFGVAPGNTIWKVFKSDFGKIGFPVAINLSNFKLRRKRLIRAILSCWYLAMSSAFPTVPEMPTPIRFLPVSRMA